MTSQDRPPSAGEDPDWALAPDALADPSADPCFDIEPPPPAEPVLRCFPDGPRLAAAVADALVLRIGSAIRERGLAQLVLTGGSMGTAVVAALAERADEVEARRVHLWWGDERFVPAGDPDRNDAQADAAGLARLGVPPAQVHRAPAAPASGATAGVDQAARAYATRLAEGGGVPAFDVLLLGVGPDGHVASLFPGHPALAEDLLPVTGVRDSPKPPPVRLTMSLPTIQQARAVWLVVSGSEKAEAVARGWQAPDAWVCPASAARGREETIWWCDEAAAAQLPGRSGRQSASTPP